MLAELRHGAPRWLGDACVMVALTTAGCMVTRATGHAQFVLEDVAIDDAATLTVSGRLCDVRPPVRLELQETLETYPVRLVIGLRAEGTGAGCGPFRAVLPLASLPPFAESCQDRCLIHVRITDGPGRSVWYVAPKGGSR